MVIGVWEYKFCIPFYIGLILAITAGYAEVVKRKAGAGAIAFVTILACAAAAQGHAALQGIDALLRPSEGQHPCQNSGNVSTGDGRNFAKFTSGSH